MSEKESTEQNLVKSLTKPLTKQDKQKALKAVQAALEKTFDTKGIFQSQGSKVGLPIPHIKTSLPSVDNYLIGCGGVPRGRIIEIFGPESSGKTAFTCHVIGECQRAGGVAAFVDAEHALDPTFATKLGVDMDELIISQPDYGEQALSIVESLVDAEAVDLIVVDSVSQLVPKAELDGDMGDSHMGLQARLMSQAMRKLVGVVSKKNVTVIFINQTRDKIGLVFGDPTVTSGGKALKFAASLRLEVRKIANSKGGEIKLGEQIIGHRMNIKAKKNKCGVPFRETIIDLYYESGFDTREDKIAHAITCGVVLGNAWLTFKDGDPKEKFRRDDLPIDRVEKAVAKYYSELVIQPPIPSLKEEDEDAEQETQE